MTELRDIALFFRLGLRVDVLTTEDVERWIHSVLASRPQAEYPATELLWASGMARSTVDELLGEFPGSAGEFMPGRMLMALIARRLAPGPIRLKQAVEIGAAVGNVGELSDEERCQFEGLAEVFDLAGMDASINLGELARDVREQFARYRAYDGRLPATL